MGAFKRRRGAESSAVKTSLALPAEQPEVERGKHLRSLGIVKTWNAARGRGTAKLRAVKASVHIGKADLQPPLTCLSKGQRILFTLGSDARGLIGCDICLAPSAHCQITLPDDASRCSSSRSAVGQTSGSEEPVSGRIEAANAEKHSQTVLFDSSSNKRNERGSARWLLAVPRPSSAKATAAQLEPAPCALSEDPLRSLMRHSVRSDANESPLAAAYNRVVDAYAQTQLNTLFADHTSSRFGSNAKASNAEAAERLTKMQEEMLAWRESPTAAEICEAHETLMEEGGGIFRTTPVRAGKTRFITPSRKIAAALEEFANALRFLIQREDVSTIAKAGWAGFHLMCLHPFRDGNGRLARGLVNAVLIRGGVPFVVGLAASEAQRSVYREALRDGHRNKGSSDSRPFAAVVRASVMRSFAALEALWAAKSSAAVDAATGAQARSLRDDARRGECLICLDSEPTSTLLCCGAAIHHACLTRWLRSSMSCPQCRAAVPQPELRVPAAPLGPQRGSRDFAEPLQLLVRTSSGRQWEVTTSDSSQPDDSTTQASHEDDTTTDDSSDDTTSDAGQEDDTTTMSRPPDAAMGFDDPSELFRVESDSEDVTTSHVGIDDITVEVAVERNITSDTDSGDDTTSLMSQVDRGVSGSSEDDSVVRQGAEDDMTSDASSADVVPHPVQQNYDASSDSAAGETSDEYSEEGSSECSIGR